MSIQNPDNQAAFLHKETLFMQFAIPEAAAGEKSRLQNSGNHSTITGETVKMLSPRVSPRGAWRGSHR